MPTLTIRSSMQACLMVLLISAGAVAGLDWYGKNNRVSGRIGALQDKNIDKELVDHPRDAYRVWKKAGYQGRTAVFVADRWESFDPGDLIPQQMYRAYPLELYNTAKLLEDEHLNGTTFLYVASMNKMIRRIVAIVPEVEVERMRKLAPTVKDSKSGSQGVFLSRQGFPRWYSTAANFTGAGEPVLLYVGASYFRSAEPEDLVRQLSSSGLQTDCLILCNEAGKDTVTARETAKLVRFARLVGMVAPAAAAPLTQSPRNAPTPGKTP